MDSKDQRIDELEKQLKVEKNKSGALKIRMEKAEARLNLLQRHQVYGFYTHEGRLFYAGQETNEG
jgi:hypothetical protein